jgi:omega-6 fatty acid desaturase (delta-12 desaturase)
MLLSLEVSYWLTLALALPAAGLLVRLFIIQHDCGHGSFFASRRLNDLVGSLIGVLTLTPYQYWRRTHALHHANTGNLEHRDFGEVETLTVAEYKALSRWGKLRYRVYRHPLVLFVVGPVYQFVVKHRAPWDAPRSWRKEWRGVMLTNLGLAAILAAAWATVGLERFLLVQVPITLLSGTLGVWLFYVQHQFEDTYWENPPEWAFHDAALEGSSFYDLPRVLDWFTGSIGFHHVHHLASRIPNYRLRQAMREVPELSHVTRLTLRDSLATVRLKLWDEERSRMVGFADVA